MESWAVDTVVGAGVGAFAGTEVGADVVVADRAGDIGSGGATGPLTCPGSTVSMFI